MGKDSLIEWCHDTENLVWGCDKVTIGCDFCYAEKLSNRWGHKLWGKDSKRKETKNWYNNILKYNKLAVKNGETRRVFIGSMFDIFEKKMPVINHKYEEMPYDTLHIKQKLFTELVPICQNILHLFLTKRPSNIPKQVPKSWLQRAPNNVMFGTSISDQETANTLVPLLLKVNGYLFLSIEPMLGPIDLEQIKLPEGKTLKDIHWIIVGGESGHGKRPFNPDWARLIRDQCKQYQIPFFMKQWDKVKEIPEDLMIREFPILQP